MEEGEQRLGSKKSYRNWVGQGLELPRRSTGGKGVCLGTGPGDGCFFVFYRDGRPPTAGRQLAHLDSASHHSVCTESAVGIRCHDHGGHILAGVQASSLPRPLESSQASPLASLGGSDHAGGWGS